MSTILIDLDNTLIETKKFRLTTESKRLFSMLWEEGHDIIGFTSRPKILKPFTLWHLRKLGVKLDRLIMNKPRGDVYIGNRAVHFDCRCSNATRALNEVHIILNRSVEDD